MKAILLAVAIVVSVWNTGLEAKPRPHVHRTPTVAQAKAYARERLGATQYRCFYALMQRESRWNPRATNRNSGAYGIPQSLPGSKMRTAGKDWRTNPITQVKWGIRYVNGRYGSACKAYRHALERGWY